MYKLRCITQQVEMYPMGSAPPLPQSMVSAPIYFIMNMSVYHHGDVTRIGELL